MVKGWLKNGKGLLNSNGKAPICDICPCGNCLAWSDTLQGRSSIGADWFDGGSGLWSIDPTNGLTVSAVATIEAIPSIAPPPGWTHPQNPRPMNVSIHCKANVGDKIRIWLGSSGTGGVALVWIVGTSLDFSALGFSTWANNNPCPFTVTECTFNLCIGLYNSSPESGGIFSIVIGSFELNLPISATSSTYPGSANNSAIIQIDIQSASGSPIHFTNVTANYTNIEDSNSGASPSCPRCALCVYPQVIPVTDLPPTPITLRIAGFATGTGCVDESCEALNSDISLTYTEGCIWENDDLSLPCNIVVDDEGDTFATYTITKAQYDGWRGTTKLIESGGSTIWTFGNGSFRGHAVSITGGDCQDANLVMPLINVLFGAGTDCDVDTTPPTATIIP